MECFICKKEITKAEMFKTVTVNHGEGIVTVHDRHVGVNELTPDPKMGD